MTAPIAKDVLASATLHLEVLEEFIGVVRRKLTVTDNAFARDSLTDLLLNLTEQRDGYQALTTLPAAIAV
ncbi:hypothetical protein VY88_28935 [Azospirillum thiophilum]|uniref:Uncharacterized protein n=1 Tax=Azospirillum thiophilum TaxID=528244 RepID=A0AAC8ZWG4_9PROT|nr:hypothetical protein [Azospirillum thiophilum]ALG75608.1 hypothetical protein AL072_32265 [Azospirillum thiophilum]KJR62127.1 hypothetical protein VY88_28935 [Azospirillum thiophilum]